MPPTGGGSPAISAHRSGGRIELATGAVGEAASWGRRAAWCDYSGTVGGSRYGGAIFDHPGNPLPAHWHVRGYGLMAVNPFGLRDFFGDPALDGSLRVRPNEPLRFAYRLLVHSGDAHEGRVAEHFDRFAGGEASSA